MQNAAIKSEQLAGKAEDGAWLRLGLSAIAIVTLLRVVALAFNRTDLFVDEAQYWLWGREMAFGAYSKPPLIGWIIRAATQIAGDGTFGVRLAAPLMHGVTAALLFVLARTLYDVRISAIAALTYVTLPAAALGSLLISTDTPMMLFIVLALICVRRLAVRRASGGNGFAWSVGLGLAFGLGLMSKYAMLYLLACLPLAAWCSESFRLRRRDALVAALVALVVIAPNLWWNSAHDFATARHTADNANWSGLRLHPLKALEFFASQAGVVGPFVFAALLVGAWNARAFEAKVQPGFPSGNAITQRTRGGGTGQARALVALCLPILLLITAQALMSRAHANWAVGAYAAGVLLAAPVLASRRWLLSASLALNGFVTIALPLLTIFGTELRLPDGRLALDRYLGRAALVAKAAQEADKARAKVLVASDRSYLAEIFYQLRDQGRLQLRALPGKDGAASSHYALLYALKPGEEAQAVYLSDADGLPACLAGQSPVAQWAAGPGFAQGQAVGLWRLPSGCTEASADAK